MNICLTHPIHGAKIATMEQEAEADEKNGWTRYNPDEPAPVNELEVAKRGRPRRIPTEALNV